MKIPHLLGTVCALLLSIVTNSVFAAFVTYTSESNWQTAAGTTILEDFQSYSVNTQITSLPLLGVDFEMLAGGGYPATYNHFSDGSGYGSMHLSNFPNGIGGTNQWDDIILNVMPGYQVTALGFWNGDGQSDTLMATVYDASDNVLGTVGAFKDTFAGFVSDVPIARVVFDGDTGDGWNHLDGLQTNANVVPVPAAVWLFVSGLLGLIGISRRREFA